MLKAENQSECVCCEESLAVKEIMTIWLNLPTQFREVWVLGEGGIEGNRRREEPFSFSMNCCKSHTTKACIVVRERVDSRCCYCIWICQDKTWSAYFYKHHILFLIHNEDENNFSKQPRKLHLFSTFSQVDRYKQLRDRDEKEAVIHFIFVLKVYDSNLLLCKTCSLKLVY